MQQPHIMQIPSVSQGMPMAVPSRAPSRHAERGTRSAVALPRPGGYAVSSSPGPPRPGDALSLRQMEQAHIRGVLAGSPSLEAAAKALGIDVSTLYRKRKLYGLR